MSQEPKLNLNNEDDLFEGSLNGFMMDEMKLSETDLMRKRFQEWDHLLSIMTPMMSRKYHINIGNISNEDIEKCIKIFQNNSRQKMNEASIGGILYTILILQHRWSCDFDVVFEISSKPKLFFLPK